MRAARIVGPGRFEFIDIDPPQVQEGEVLVRLHSLSVCGSDLRVFDRVLPEEEYPLETGRSCHECAGVIEESHSDDYKVGQRAIVLPIGSTGLAEYVAVPASRVIPLPDEGDLAQLVMCQHMGTVMYSCDRIGSVIGKRVMILGQGPIGLNFTYWMAKLGARQVIVTDLYDYRLDAAKKLGATHTINASREDVPAAVEEITQGEMADVVIEVAGQPETVNQMFRVLRLQGLAVLFGQPHIEDTFPINYDQMQSKLPTIIATISSRTNEPTRHIKECVDLVAQGRLDLSHLATHRMSFDDVHRAYEMYSAKEDNVLKIVMEL